MRVFFLISIIALSFINSSFAKENSHEGHEHSAAETKLDPNSEDYKKKIAAQVKAQEDYVNKVREFEKSPEFKQDILNKKLPNDVVVGKKKAPVKIVEYASLSCIHCKEFHEKVYYNLKKDFIDSGKVYYIYRHFPLNGPALKAAIVTSCVGETSRAAFIGALFKGQNQWAYTKNEAGLIDRLKTISKIGGLSSEQFEKCYNDEAKQNELLALQKDAATGLRIDATPAIFVDGVRYIGSRSYDDFKKMLEEKLAKAAKGKKTKKNKSIK